MPAKRYIVSLTPEERESLEQITRKGKTTASKINHARILLKADINSPEGSWKDEDISKALNISRRTIERVRQRFVEDGLENALIPRTRHTLKLRKLDGEAEAHLIALACSQAPVGSSRWTLRLLADQMVVLGYIESVSYETVRQVLKKTSLSLG